MMNTVAASLANPDRAFARLSVVSILFGMVMVAAVPLACICPARIDTFPRLASGAAGYGSVRSFAASPHKCEHTP